MSYLDGDGRFPFYVRRRTGGPLSVLVSIIIYVALSYCVHGKDLRYTNLCAAAGLFPVANAKRNKCLDVLPAVLLIAL
jgi:hypothetical protein